MGSFVDSRNAQATTDRIIAHLEEVAAEAMEGLAVVLAAAVAERSPTPIEEYESLMGEGYDTPAFTGTGSADNESEEPGRVRFIKEPGTFLQELAERIENREIGDGYLMLGNIAFLNAYSTFQYKDYVPTKRPRKGVNYDTEFMTVGPYFEAFEFGTADWTVLPRRAGYPLRPDDDPSHRPMQMSKPIEARFAYSPIDLNEIALRYLDERFAEVSSK